jgi:hypothetical protein
MGLKSTFQHAALYLEKDFQKRGYWEDFETLAGKSNQWVTAYIAYNLVAVENSLIQRLVKDAWNYLRRRWWGAHRHRWGFNQWVPSDADSTTWTLLLAQSLGINSAAVHKGREFLQQHVCENGGICTFSDDKPIRLFTKLKSEISFKGWCSAHTCVTGAYLAINDIVQESTLNYVLDAQQEEGEWLSYWWVSSTYATCLITEGLVNFLHGSHHERVDKAIKKSIKWAKRFAMEHDNASTFEIAFILRILLVESDIEASTEVNACMNALLGKQSPDGSWQSSSLLQIPPPDVLIPANYKHWVLNGKGGGAIIHDLNRCFTTATVLNALSKAHDVQRK